MIIARMITAPFFLLLLGVFTGCEDAELFDWRDRIVPVYTADGWVVFSESANWMDPTMISTWFKKPVVQIGFYRPSDVRRSPEGLLLVRVVWTGNPVVWHEEVVDTFNYAIDCGAK